MANYKSMKVKNYLLFVVSVVSVFSVDAFSLELPQGNYTFQGQVAAISHKITEVVYASTPTGQARLAQLKTDGYTCKYVYQQQMSCSIFSRDLQIPAPLLESIELKYTNYAVMFGLVDGVELLNKSEFLIEYQVSQKVQSLDFQTRIYNLSVMSGGLHKISMPTQGQKAYFNYTSPDSLQIVSVHKQTKGLVTQTYVIEVSLSK